MNKEQLEHLEKGRDEQQEQRRQGEQGQNTEQERSKQGKQVRFGEEQQLVKTGAENAGEPEVMGRTTEVRTCREEVQASSEGEMRGVGRTRPTRKAKERVRMNMKAEEEDLATKENSKRRGRERGGAGPNGAKHGGRWLIHPGHIRPREERGKERDCEDDERKEEEEREQKKEKETRQETEHAELTSEKPPGLEQREESELERKKERGREESAGGARGEESAGGARGEERAQDALEEVGAQERRKERKVEAQKGHDGEEKMTTQERCVEVKKGANSLHEESDVSNRHMTWWKNAWWIRVDSGPNLRTARSRRRIWRAARRAAEQARDDDRVEETRILVEEAEGETM